MQTAILKYLLIGSAGAKKYICILSWVISTKLCGNNLYAIQILRLQAVPEIEMLVFPLRFSTHNPH